MQVFSKLKQQTEPYSWYEIDELEIEWTVEEMEFYFNIHHYC
jgi:hypothetical protein